MEKAFDPGYDPALEIAKHGKGPGRVYEDAESEHLRRQEQDLIDEIISGKRRGHYYMLLGPKVF